MQIPKMPNPPPFAGQSPSPSGKVPEDPWADVATRLQKLQPTEPGPEILERVWQSVAQGIKGPHAMIIQSLIQAQPSQPDSAALNRIWKRVSMGIEARQAPATRQFGRRISWGWAVALTLVFILLVGAVNVASASALPGSMLYPAKRAFETVRLELTLDPQDRAQFALLLADRRLEEAKILIEQGASPELVSQTLEDSLAYLAIAASSVPPEQIVSRIDTWKDNLQGWPVAYQASTVAVFNAWLQTNPTLLGDSGGVIPTLVPPGKSTPTFMPSLPVVSPSLPPATQLPTVIETPIIPASVPTVSVTLNVGLTPTLVSSTLASPPPTTTLLLPTLPPILLTPTPTKTPGGPTRTPTPPPTSSLPTLPPILLTPTPTKTPGGPTRTPTAPLPTVTLPLPSLTPVAPLPTVTLPLPIPTVTATLPLPIITLTLPFP